MTDQPHSRPGASPPGMLPAAPNATPEVPLDMSHLTTTYVNYFHACGSPRELILDFGLHSGLRMSSGPEPVHVTQRLIMPMLTAKQLLDFLHLLIRNQEKNFGPLQATPSQPNPSPSTPPNPTPS